MRTRRLAIAIALFALLGSVCGSLLISNKSKHPVSGKPREAATPSGRNCDDQLGFEDTFDLRLSTSAINGDNLASEVNIQATLRQATIHCAQNGSLSRVMFADARLAGASMQDEAVRNGVVSSLKYATFLTHDRNGALVTVRLPEQTAPLASDIVTGIASLSQIVHDSAEGSKTWSATESDSAGKYIANYTVEPNGHIRKAKDHYIVGTRPSGARWLEANAEPRVQKSLTTIEIVEGHPRSIDASEMLQAGGDLLSGLRVDTRLTLTWKSRAPMGRDAQASALAQAVAVPETAIGEAAERTARNPAIDRARTGGKGLPELLGDLRSAAKEKDPEKRDVLRARAFVGIAALLRLDPTGSERVLDRVRANDPLTESLIDALGSSGAVAAQAALVKLSEESSSLAVRLRCLRSLGMSPAPTPETVAALTRAIDSPGVAGTAKTSLGAALYRYQQVDAPAAEKGASELESRLNSDSQSEKNTDLTALGNAGIPSTLKSISAYLTSPDPLLRASAISGLRRIPGSEADAAIASAALRDSDENVRQVALNCAAERAESDVLFSAVDQSVRLDTSVNVRFEALKTLRAWMSSSARARSTIEWVSKNEPVDTMRALATNSLARLDRDAT